MAFDDDLARKLLACGDRDFAPYFAGRDKEIRSFGDALVEAQGKPQGVFRVFQGAPGCGKTSLARHIRESHASKLALVSIFEDDLGSPDSLIKAINRGVTRGNPLSRQALEGAGVLAALLRRDSAADALAGATANRMLAQTRLALHFDEAQTLAQPQAPTLRWLHTGGLGLPCVVVFTGLTHTAERFGSLDGLARPADNAICNMGRLTREECIASTNMMLDATKAEGAFRERLAPVEAVVDESFEWPQHLHCAQQELVRELVKARGALRHVDLGAMRTVISRRRHSYYQGRFHDVVLGYDVEATKRVAYDIAQHRPRDMRGLVGLCTDALQRERLDEDPGFAATAREFAEAMVAKGIVALTPERQWDIPIPSMATWLAAAPERTEGPRKPLQQ